MQIASEIEENKERGIVMYQEGEIAGHFEENQRWQKEAFAVIKRLKNRREFRWSGKKKREPPAREHEIVNK